MSCPDISAEERVKRNVRLKEIRREVSESLKGVPHTGDHSMRLTLKKFHEEYDIPYDDTPSPPPEIMLEETPIKSVLPDGVPSPARTPEVKQIAGEVVGVAPKLNASLEPGEKVPDIDPMVSVNKMSPPGPPPIPSVRTA